MDFLFSGIFWGIVIVLFGISIIINVVFHVHIPLMRILFGLFLVFLGVQLISGQRWHPFKKSSSTSETFVAGKGNDEYSVMFGRNTVDLTQGVPGKQYTVNTVFGATTVLIPSAIPVVVKADAVFGGMTFPNGTTVSFGEHIYKNKAWTDQGDAMKVSIDLVFGGCSVVEK